MRRRIAVLVCWVGAAACGSSSTGPGAAATRVAFTVQPTSTTGGHVLAPAIQVALLDSSGNTVRNANGSVTIAIGTNPGAGTLSGTTTVDATNGVATFSALSIDKAGTAYTLVASAPGLTGATSTTFTIAVGPPATLAFTGQPSNTVAGQVISPAVQVTVQDAGHNTVTSATTSVSLSLGTNPAGGALTGGVTVSAVNGVAKFAALFVNKAASGYTLAATADSLTPATSAIFAIAPGAPTQLAFTGQPTTVVAGRVMTPAVQVAALDAEGNVATSFAGNIMLALGANPGGGTLSGTLMSAATSGIASFANLSVNDLGNGYTLVATSGTLAATSATFIVGTTGIYYHGGPIIYTPRIAALYWSPVVIYTGGPKPGTSGSPASADQSLVAIYLRSLGGSPYFNINATYYDGTNTYIQNALTYGQYWADSTAPGASPNDSAMAAEIERGFATGALSYDPNTLYAIFTAAGVNLGGGFGTQYCAYHSYFVDSQGRNVKFAAMPYDHEYEIGPGQAGCSFATLWGSPNDDPGGDAEVNVLSHELSETVTDENLNAWWVYQGNTGYEMADLCNFNFGTTFRTVNAATANESIGGRDFLVQMLWVNMEDAAGLPIGCQQGWTMGASEAARNGLRAPAVVTASRQPSANRRHVMAMYRSRTP